MSRYIQGASHLDKEHELYRRNAYSNKILILRNGGILYSFLLQDGRVRKAAREEQDDMPIGTVILGKVINVAKQFGGAFFSLESAKGKKGRTGFLQIKENMNYRPVNREADGRILSGDEIPVQIIKPAKGSKPPQLTTEYSLAGQAVVIKKGSGRVSYSLKMAEEDKQRLGGVFENWRGILLSKEPERATSFQGCDITFRTNAPAVKEEIWEKEIIDLISQLQAVDQGAKTRTVYSRLYEPEAFYLDFIKDQQFFSLEEIVTDEKDVYERLAAHPCAAVAPVRFYKDERVSLQSVYALNTRLEELMAKKVYMKSGAYLMIEPTEALTAIDVNTGKCEKNMEPEEFYYLVNLEAVKEVCYQLSARNISGMILVDFINMKDKAHVNKLIEALKKETAKDPVPTHFVDMTKLGLAEITRKKASAALRHTLRDWG